MNALEKVTLQRSISLPVQECLSAPWPEFLHQLHGCWRQSTDLANWASQTLARHDVLRLPGMACLPPWQAIDLYALAFGRDRSRPARNPAKPPLPVVAAQYDGGDFWAGGKIAAATLLRKVQSKYVRERGKVIWRRERRTPEFLYPYPFPVHQQSWLPLWSERGRPVVNLALPGGRVSLRLRNGDEFRPALRVFGQLVEGEVRQQELILCRQLTSGRNGRQDSQRRPGGGHRASYRVMVRIAYRLDVTPSTCDGLALLRTGADPFLSLAIGDAAPWVLHAPWVRRWIVEHERFLADFSDDLKYEKRWPAHKRRALNRYRERRCEKHARRMKSFLQQTAAQVVGHAARRKCGRIEYDDSCRDFAAKFPWHALTECLDQRCAKEGMAFHAASAAAVNSDREEVQAQD